MGVEKEEERNGDIFHLIGQHPHFNIKGSETLSLLFVSLGMQRKNVLVLKTFSFRENH